ncbi:MAG: hypothetical protein COA96_17040 [SAR86 cluster bacterium]|uniref:PRD domain-containing protein n=1 Tax=SAR86 cluster bacterium TaxID=2030880 RepID=A0A2A5AGA6_9GAMM|nr:MAG: hypothetical protein COA96_17040 [SAR86 cluster bacterium]
MKCSTYNSLIAVIHSKLSIMNDHGIAINAEVIKDEVESTIESISEQCSLSVPKADAVLLIGHMSRLFKTRRDPGPMIGVAGDGQDI